MQAEAFRKILLNWHENNPRPLPWKSTKDAYTIWISEVILQQTRMEQGLPYFQKFIQQYPTIADLAKAKEDDVMRLWQGLGYYSRARNMHETAKLIRKKYKGKFPEDFAELKKLKGVGNYTAAAIASFAFDLPHAVVDGNVFRVLSRLDGIETPIDTTEGKNQFQKLAEKYLDKKHPARYNQAMMDFGATQCVPKNPNCEICVFKKNCKALQQSLVADLPIKEKKIKKKNRYFNFFYITDGKFILIEKRTQEDIWKNLFQFPLIESEKFLSKEELLKPAIIKKHAVLKNLKSKDKKNLRQGILKQQDLTHQKLFVQFYLLKTEDVKKLISEGFSYIDLNLFSLYAFPKAIADFLNGLKEMTLF